MAFRGENQGRATLAHQINKVKEFRLGLTDRIGVLKQKRPGGASASMSAAQGKRRIECRLWRRSPDVAKVAFAGT